MITVAVPVPQRVAYLTGGMNVAVCVAAPGDQPQLVADEVHSESTPTPTHRVER